MDCARGEREAERWDGPFLDVIKMVGATHPVGGMGLGLKGSVDKGGMWLRQASNRCQTSRIWRGGSEGGRRTAAGRAAVGPNVAGRRGWSVGALRGQISCRRVRAVCKGGAEVLPNFRSRREGN